MERPIQPMDEPVLALEAAAVSEDIVLSFAAYTQATSASSLQNMQSMTSRKLLQTSQPSSKSSREEHSHAPLYTPCRGKDSADDAHRPA